MHLFTLTLHTKLFSQKFEDEIMEELSLEFFGKFYGLLEKYQLAEHLEFKLFWRQACLVEDIIVVSKNKEWLRHFYKNEEPLKEDDAYQKLLADIRRLMDEFPKSVALGKAMFEIDNWYISTKDFESRGKCINSPLEKMMNRNKRSKN